MQDLEDNPLDRTFQGFQNHLQVISSQICLTKKPNQYPRNQVKRSVESTELGNV